MTPTSHGDDEDPRRQAPGEERTRLLRERTRAGLWITLIGLGVLWVADFAVHRDEIRALSLITLAQTGFIGLGFLVLPRIRTWAGLVALPITVVGGIFATGVVSDVLSANPEGTGLSSLVVCMISATLLPWGVWPQVLMVLVTGLCGALSVLLCTGSLASLGYAAGPGLIMFLASISVAHAVERARRERERVERDLEVARRRAEGEAQIAAVLVEVGQTLSARLGQSDMIELVNALAVDALACDWSCTFMCDEASGLIRLTDSAGVRAEVQTEMAQVTFSSHSLPATQALAPDGLLEIADAERQTVVPVALMQRMEAASALYAPVVLGGVTIGAQVHGYCTRRGAFSAEQRRLAAGIAHATAIALANAQLIRDLQSASRLKSEFVATMSHELRTPLNVIMGYAGMLTDRVLGELNTEQEDTLSRIQRSALELLELVNATLDLGRFESGRDTVSCDVVEIDQIFRALDRELAPLVAPQVTLAWVDRLDGRPILIDKVKIRTILKNLVANALKFTHTGRVEVTATADDAQVTLQIRDTGIGIAAEDLPIIFEMFRQVDASSTSTAGGVGLGLYIVRQLVERLNGSITVDSTPGVGSTFTVRVPLPLDATVGRPGPGSVDAPRLSS
jgi:signal transduction histidine kinase